MDLDDILFHLGEDYSENPHPGSAPIYQSSNFLFPTVADMQKALAKEDQIPFYTRGTNPTVQLLCRKLAALERTEGALAFASGSAAIAAAILSSLKKGGHVLCSTNPYSWTKKLLTHWVTQFDIEVSFFSKEKGFSTLIKPNTCLIFVESPNSWTFEEISAEAITQYGKEHGITTILDNSYSSPIVMQGGALGFDITVHAATKYIGGHSDVVAGILCASEEKIASIFDKEYMLLGGILSPFDAWLLLRSLKTLPVRMERIKKTTALVTSWLRKHPKIKKLYYPENGGTGLFSIDLDTDQTGVEVFCNALRKFRLGPSWGSTDSLVFPALATLNSRNYHHREIVIERIRLSVGLENPDTLIADLKQALGLI